jgi:hypothetical protein
MKHLHLTVVMALMTLVVPSSVFAQENDNAWGGRGFVTFNVGAQTGSHTFDYQFATTLFQQNATAGVNVPGKSGLSFEVGAGLRLVQNLGVGVTYSRYSQQRTATLSTTIPNPMYEYLPYFIDGYPYSLAPGSTSQEIPLQREENAVHIQAMYRIPVGSRIQLGAFGGPSYFRCIDDHITKFALQGTFSPNYDFSVAIQDVSQLIDRASTWGYHGGGSFTYLATRHVGVGVTVRYSYGSHTTINHFSDTTYLTDLAVWGGDAGTTSVTMKHGGIQWNGGISVHF